MWSLDHLRPLFQKRCAATSLHQAYAGLATGAAHCRRASCRLHPVSAGVLHLRLLPGAAHGRQILVTQGRDGVTHLWACTSDLKDISE